MAKGVNKDSKISKEKKSSKDSKNFFKEFKAELKRVNWPTFKQLVNNTLAVLAIIVIVAVIVFVLDIIFENLNNFGVNKLKALVSSNSIENTTSDDDVVLNLDDIETVDEESNTENNEETSTEEVQESLE